MAFPLTVTLKYFPVCDGMVWRFLLLTSTVDSPRVMTLFCDTVVGRARVSKRLHLQVAVWCLPL